MSEQNDVREPTRSAMERHVQSAIMAILVLVIGWAGAKLDGLTAILEQMAVLKTKMESLEGEVKTLRDRSQDLYTSSDARRDNRVLEDKISRLDDRVRSLETRRPEQ